MEPDCVKNVSSCSSRPPRVPHAPCGVPDQHTWYLLVELKGISTILVYFSLISITEPQQTSMHFNSADSEASPATARWGETLSVNDLGRLTHMALLGKRKPWMYSSLVSGREKR